MLVGLVSAQHAPHGGFAASIAIDARRLYRVDPRIDDIAAAILEPTTVAVHAVRRSQIRLGDSVVVLGAGPIGLLVLQAARAAGAGTVILIEPQRSRRDLGATLGADVVIDPGTGDVAEAVNAHVGAQGADVVIECAGIARDTTSMGGERRMLGTPDTLGTHPWGSPRAVPGA